jgi:segregation and condensation protein B
MDQTVLKAIVEAVVFAAEEPVTMKQLCEVLEVQADELEPVVAALRQECSGPERGIRLSDVAGGLRFQTRADYHPWIKLLFKSQRSVRLSMQALQTLAIIAYKQPVTGPEIEDIRKVDSSGVLKNLLDKRLIKVLGRKEVVGRPLLYGTTREFLLQFGLKELGELPRLEEFAELIEAELGETAQDPEATEPAETPDAAELGEQDAPATDTAPDEAGRPEGD